MAHRYDMRVYYEDTDLAGIVYYANYLKFIERARSEWVRGLGIDQKVMKNRDGVVFAVRRVEADYLTPAVFDDELVVSTFPTEITGAKMVLQQVVTRGEETLFTAQVTLAVLGKSGKPIRMPAAIRAVVQ